MLHIWNQDRFAAATPASDNLAMDAPSVEDLRRNHALDEIEEYEFILGRRQLASLSFVVLVLVAVAAGIAYLVGRSAAAHVEAPSAGANKRPVEIPAPVPNPAPGQISESKPPLPDLFSTPIVGAIYIQTAAVDRGVGAIMAEGLRTHGLPALVAPGPNDKIFRVLVGPFPNMTAYQRTKQSLEELGLSAFAQFQSAGQLTADRQPAP